ncbi:MAG: hypothetical protein R2713_03050 [Ilumatobacteraceae bacterium]
MLSLRTDATPSTSGVQMNQPLADAGVGAAGTRRTTLRLSLGCHAVQEHGLAVHRHRNRIGEEVRPRRGLTHDDRVGGRGRFTGVILVINLS